MSKSQVRFCTNWEGWNELNISFVNCTYDMKKCDTHCQCVSVDLLRTLMKAAVWMCLWVSALLMCSDPKLTRVQRSYFRCHSNTLGAASVNAFLVTLQSLQCMVQGQCAIHPARSMYWSCRFCREIDPRGRDPSCTRHPILMGSGVQQHAQPEN